MKLTANAGRVHYCVKARIWSFWRGLGERYFGALMPFEIENDHIRITKSFGLRKAKVTAKQSPTAMTNYYLDGITLYVPTGEIKLDVAVGPNTSIQGWKI